MQTKYSGANFYFFTGTGNSFRVATWLAGECGLAGIPASVASLAGADPSADSAMDGAGRRLAGLSFPTHGFTAPWPVIRFALSLPRGRGTHAVVLPTRAGTKLGRIFAPGLEGTAGYLIGLILALKGYSVRGIIGIDMPSNWTAVHPGFSESAAGAIVERARGRVARFMAPVLAGRRHFTGLVPLLLGVMLLTVSLGYMLMGRPMLAKLFFASFKCNGCGLCQRSCPAKAIRMIGRYPPRPYWTFYCENCMRCMNFCPRQAVEASHPLAVGLYFAATSTIWLVFLNWLGTQIPVFAGPATGLLRLMVQYVYVLSAAAAIYLIFTQAIRFMPVNRIVSALTLTSYFKRYRAPDVELKDIL